MKALLLKDFYVITKQLKIFIIAIIIMSITSGSSLAMLSIFFGATIPLTAIAYDERSKWTDFAEMLPYTKLEIILSKYLLGYICIFGAAALAILGSNSSKIFFSKIFFSNIFSSQNMFISYDTILCAIVTALMFLAINLFVMLKFGSENSFIYFRLF